MLADLDLRLELTSPTRLSWCPVRLNTKTLRLFLEVTQDKAEATARIGCGSFYAIKGAGFEIQIRDQNT